jgi:hypothetical protein
MTDDKKMIAKVVPIGINFKDGLPLEIAAEVAFATCVHGQFQIDSSLDVVTCGICEEKLNPMFVLKRLAQQDSRFRQNSEIYQDQMKRLAERSRTKCEHCKNMTRISQN